MGDFRQRFNAVAGGLLSKVPGFRPKAPDPAKMQAFEKACVDGDLATASALAKKKSVPAGLVAQGLAHFIVEKQKFDGLEALVAASGIQQMPGQFVQVVLGSVPPEKQIDVIRFLNQQKVPFQAHDLIPSLLANNDAATMEILGGGGFNPQQDHSVALLFAATLQNKNMFVELCKHGAIPQDALVNGPTDSPAFVQGYRNVTAWMHELYTGELGNLLQQKIASFPPADPAAQPPEAAAPGTPAPAAPQPDNGAAPQPAARPINFRRYGSPGMNQPAPEPTDVLAAAPVVQTTPQAAANTDGAGSAPQPAARPINFRRYASWKPGA